MYQAGTVGQISHCLPVELVGDTELSRVLPAQLAALGACVAARAGLEALLTGAPGASAVCRTPNKIKLCGWIRAGRDFSTAALARLPPGGHRYHDTQ